MTARLFLDYLDPPGALVCRALFEDVKDAAPEDQCLGKLFQRAFFLTATHLQDQIMAAGKVAHGHRSPQSYVKAWQKTARPIAHVKCGEGLYLLAYIPGHRHPLAEQAWMYFKLALDLVSDDARDGLIFGNIFRYDAELPARLLAAQQKLPRLTWPAA